VPDSLRLVIKTPHQTVLDIRVAAIRVPTETGLVGIRPGGEPLVVALEPGLIVIRIASGERFAATAGGLLESGRSQCTVLTPYAAVGNSEPEIEEALNRILATPSTEVVARRRLEELEQRIVKELSQSPGSPSQRRKRHG
jgi:F0F1-type ATP synthase epsilon subunit